VPTGGYCFLRIGRVLGNIASSCALLVQCTAYVIFDFVDAAFVIVWGGVVSLSFREVFYRIDASECYSYVCVLNMLVILHICGLHDIQNM
jgi:hypothetical protein